MTTDRVKLIQGKFIWCAISVYKIILRLFKAYISEFSMPYVIQKDNILFMGLIFLISYVNIFFYMM